MVIVFLYYHGPCVASNQHHGYKQDLMHCHCHIITSYSISLFGEKTRYTNSTIGKSWSKNIAISECISAPFFKIGKWRNHSTSWCYVKEESGHWITFNISNFTVMI